MAATHRNIRNLPEYIDPVSFLFGGEKFVVPASRFTPELIARFYEKALKLISMTSIQMAGSDNPYGLTSLPSLLRYEPSPYGAKWLKLEAAQKVIEPTLPGKTSYQLQYLHLFGFELPEWKDAPLVPSTDKRFGDRPKVVGTIGGTMLLFGKNKQLYLVTARWTPEEERFGGGEQPAFLLEEGPLVFRLSHLEVEIVDWQDSRILEKIESGEWGDVHAFLACLQLTLLSAANELQSRVRSMHHLQDFFERIKIHHGR